MSSEPDKTEPVSTESPVVHPERNVSTKYTNAYIEQIFNVYCNVHEMLTDRKYNELVSGKCLLDFDLFKKEYVKTGTLDKDAMSFVRMNTTKKKDPLFVSVFFTTEESIGIKYIIKVSERMIASKISHCILIYPKSLTASAKKYMEKSSKLKIEAFAEEDLLVNITKHALMPLHQVLSSAEKKRFLSDAHLTEYQLSRIQLSDPVARYYGMKRGDMVRIIRRSDTAGKYVTFRICN